MSDTPRTDAEEIGFYELPGPAVVSADFARQLERELASMTMQMLHWRRVAHEEALDRLQAQQAVQVARQWTLKKYLLEQWTLK